LADRIYWLSKSAKVSPDRIFHYMCICKSFPGASVDTLRILQAQNGLGHLFWWNFYVLTDSLSCELSQQVRAPNVLSTRRRPSLHNRAGIFVSFQWWENSHLADIICDSTWENRAYVHIKFDHIFGFQA